MALMVLLRLPTEAELDATTLEAHTFLDVFNENAVSPFKARVKKMRNGVQLGGWNIGNAEWFAIEED